MVLGQPGKEAVLEVSLARWLETRKKLKEEGLAMPMGPLTVPKEG
jgi:hypothetical protein